MINLYLVKKVTFAMQLLGLFTISTFAYSCPESVPSGGEGWISPGLQIEDITRGRNNSSQEFVAIKFVGCSDYCAFLYDTNTKEWYAMLLSAFSSVSKIRVYIIGSKTIQCFDSNNAWTYAHNIEQMRISN
jgi:hypothetical protein